MHAGHAAQVGKAVIEQRRRSRQHAPPTKNPLAAGHFSTALDTPLRRPETRASLQRHDSDTSSVHGKLNWEGPGRPGRTTPDVTEYKTKALAAHRRWIRRNQVDDAVAGGLQKSRPGGCSSSAANVVLYVGLGMIAVGLIITFVGLGERGFQTSELRMIGPSLIGAGVFFCVLRVCLCTVGASCASRCSRTEDRRELISAELLQAVKSGRPVTQLSRKSGRSGRSSGPRARSHEAALPTHQADTSTVPVLPPINSNMGGGGGPPPVEVLLDPKDLDRPPSAGSVMSPLPPAKRRPPSGEHANSDIDDLLR